MRHSVPVDPKTRQYYQWFLIIHVLCRHCFHLYHGGKYLRNGKNNPLRRVRRGTAFDIVACSCLFLASASYWETEGLRMPATPKVWHIYVRVLHHHWPTESRLSPRLDEDRSRSHYDLKNVVEMGDFDMLKNMGTNTLLRMLSSDIKQGISTVRRDTSLLEADSTEATDVTVMSLAERRRLYGENETRAWDKRRAATEAWGPVASTGPFHPM
jgi:hypothetical protein